jgi:hypothetical protein
LFIIITEATMAAAARKPTASKKRKVSDNIPDLLQSSGPPPPEEAKKKSPLFNRPQNFYAPPPVSMTKGELSEWRKEQRRERNRESAAASRNKTRSRIEELEGEVESWKSMHREMEAKVRCMERHIELLTKLCGPHKAQALQPMTVVSHPNSPPRSDSPPTSHVLSSTLPMPLSVFPHPATSFSPPLVPDYSPRPHTVHPDPFPPLLSEPKDCAPVEEREAAAPTAAAVIHPAEESEEHITPINSRQA